MINDSGGAGGVMGWHKYEIFHQPVFVDGVHPFPAPCRDVARGCSRLIVASCCPVMVSAFHLEVAVCSGRLFFSTLVAMFNDD